MKKRKRRPTLVALLILLIGGGASAYYFLYMKKSTKAAPPEETVELALADLSLNLADRSRAHYLTASITIVIKGVKPQPMVDKHQAEIRDAVIMATTQHTYSDLLSAEGKEKLKEDIATAVEGALAGERLAVEEVLFTSFLME
jgi:flagellar FliL protein